MPLPTLTLGYDDFQKECAYDLDFGRDVSLLSPEETELIDTVIQTGVRNVLSPLVPGTTEIHEWSWARPVRTLKVRAKITGTLLKVPTRSGEQILLSAKEAVFDSDTVGLDLQFDTTGYIYRIIEFIRESVVRLVTSDRAVSGQTTRLGDFTTGTVAGLSGVAGKTTVTETDGSKSFYEDMVRDTLVNDSTGNSYEIVGYTSPTEITVRGDATGQLGAFKVVRRASITVEYNIVSDQVHAATGTFRQDMADDSDVLRFVATDNIYTIQNFSDSGNIDTSGGLSTDDHDIGDLFDIEKSYTGATYAAVSIHSTVLTATEEIFNKDLHVGMYLVFPWGNRGAPGQLSGDKRGWKSFKIAEVFAGTDYVAIVILEGDALGFVGDFIIAHALGRLASATPPTFSNGVGTVTASSAVFDSAMVGNVLYFPESETKYAITKYTSTTVVEVAGDVRVEVPGDAYFMVTGVTDMAASDAFTLLGTGGEYELPEDFAAIDGPLTYESGDGLQDVEITGEGHIRSLRASTATSGSPVYAAIRPKEFDPERGHIFEMIFWPANPSAIKTLTYRYQILYNRLSPRDKYPPGGPIFSELYLVSCLAVVEQRVKGQKGIRTSEFVEKLAAMIDHDRKAHTAEFVGGPLGRRRAVGRSWMPRSSITIGYTATDPRGY